MMSHSAYISVVVLVVAFGQENEYQTWSKGFEVIEETPGSDVIENTPSRRLNASGNASAAGASSSSTNGSSATSGASSAGNSSNGSAGSGEIVSAKFELKMSSEDATKITDAFKDEATKEKVAAGFTHGIVTTLNDPAITESSVKIVDVTAAARRLADADAEGTTLTVDSEITVPTGKTGSDVATAVTSVDVATLKTEMQNGISAKAGFNVTITSIAKPVAFVKEADGGGLLVDAASPFTMPAASLLLLLLFAFFPYA